VLRRALVFTLLGCALLGCAGQNPDYVVAQQPPACDTRSRLLRRGYPENLEELFIGNCTVTHTKNMRGPDLSVWLNTIPPFNSCDGPIDIWFWVERDPVGEITRVHFCPAYCAGLLEELRHEVSQDLVCEPDAGMAAAGTSSLPAAGATATASVAGSPAPIMP
jgi:hypothetical protein